MSRPRPPSSSSWLAALACAGGLACAGCGDGDGNASKGPTGSAALPAGARQVERVQYYDVTDVYRVYVVGQKAPLKIKAARMALIAPEDTKAGKEPYVAGDVVYLGSSFRIGLWHGVVEERLDDEQRRQNAIVRVEKRWWTPFLSQKRSLLAPLVHYPPPYKDGPLVGVGASGPTREDAFETYRKNYGELPQAMKLEMEGYVDLAAEERRERRAQGAVDAGPAIVESPVPRVAPDKASAKDNAIIRARPGSPAAAKLQERLKAAREAKRAALPKAAQTSPVTSPSAAPAPAATTTRATTPMPTADEVIAKPNKSKKGTKR